MVANEKLSSVKPIATRAAAYRPYGNPETVPKAAVSPAPKRIFLLSPARIAGPRGSLLLNETATFCLAARLRRDGAPLGEVFSFVSGLYFRGKLAYAQAFAQTPPGTPGAFVITAGQGLVPPERLITVDELHAMIAVPVEPSHSHYRKPLERDAHLLLDAAGEGCEIVLLGSVATPKYVEPLLAILGPRLVFPAEFAGRGDMSRGGLMLRCVRAGVQLTYVPVATAERHGPRPPRLPKLETGNWKFEVGNRKLHASSKDIRIACETERKA